MIIAAAVEQAVAAMVVPTISVGAAESYFMRMAIIVVGIKVKPDVLRASKVIIERLAESLPSFKAFNCSIALIPIGVAAFPNPKMLATMFDKI